jgi:hypothetical protein
MRPLGRVRVLSPWERKMYTDLGWEITDEGTLLFDMEKWIAEMMAGELGDWMGRD